MPTKAAALVGALVLSAGMPLASQAQIRLATTTVVARAVDSSLAGWSLFTGAGHAVGTCATNTGSSLAFDSFTLGSDGGQWRHGGHTAAHLVMPHDGLGDISGNVASGLSAPAGFSATSPVATTTAAAVDGNVAGLLAGLGRPVSLYGAPGQTRWLRWAKSKDTGNDHSLAIDNLNFSVTAVPEPGTAALWMAGPAALGLLARRRT